MAITSFGCEAVRDVEPQALGVTYWFDAPETASAPVQVRLVGRRVDAGDDLTDEDSFDVTTSVPEVPAGSGRAAVTTRITGIAPGRWDVTAQQTGDVGAPRTAITTQGTTVFAPMASVKAPGARLGAWPAMVLLGAVVALIVQALLAADRGLPPLEVFVLSGVASLLGIVGAKGYYLVTHRREHVALMTAGMSLQGFVIVSVTTLVLGTLIRGLGVGAVLDVTAPGLLFGMAIGRIGCLLGGCCAGRPTCSRWGVWSSDRRLGIRRIPVQLVESALAASIATLSLVATVAGAPHDGIVFLAGIAAYIVGRQLLFPLRSLARVTTYGRTASLVGGVAALAAAALLAAF